MREPSGKINKRHGAKAAGAGMRGKLHKGVEKIRGKPAGAARQGGRGAGRSGAKPGGRARPFRKGDLRLILLSLIAPAPVHGYELIKSIEQKLGGGYSPSPGVIYPTLSLLEDMGLVAGSSEGTKTLYGITDAGRAHLDEQAPEMARIGARMASFGAATNSGRSGPILRAVDKLRIALRTRTGSAPLTDEQVGAICKVLEDSAAAIEKA